MIIYLISVLGNIKTFSIVALVLTTTALLMALEHKVKSTKRLAVCVAIFFMSLTSVTLIPEEKTMYLIYGEHLAKQVASSDEGKVILDKMLKIINNKLDEQLDKGKED